jgi:hypothetical protein
VLIFVVTIQVLKICKFIFLLFREKNVKINVKGKKKITATITSFRLVLRSNRVCVKFVFFCLKLFFNVFELF